MRARILLFLAFAAFPSAFCHAGNWPSWRGPLGVGVTDEKDLPLDWDAKTGRNILWKASLKGFSGNSSPIVWDGKVFLTTADRQTHDQQKNKEIPPHHINCYAAGDGKLLWTTLIDPGKELMGSEIYAVPTPCTDGKTVYAWFGSAVMAAVNADDGKLLWRHERQGPFNLNPGIASSPALFEDTILLLCDQGRGLGWLAALDKKTGEVKWEQKREKVGVSNATPVLLQVNGKPRLIVAASSELQGLDPATGQRIWWCKARGFGSSPAYGNGVIFSDSGNGEMGVAVDPTGTGDVTASHLKWSLPKIPSQYGSAVVCGGHVYRVSDHGSMVTCWNLASGEQVFSENADGINHLTSPIATADGRIYFTSGAKSYVLKCGPAFEVLATSDLKNGDNAASAAVSDGKIFIRGNDTLFCIGKK